MVKKKSNNTLLIILIVIAVILVISLILYFFLIKENYKNKKGKKKGGRKKTKKQQDNKNTTSLSNNSDNLLATGKQQDNKNTTSLSNNSDNLFATGKDELKCDQFTGEKKNDCIDDAIKKYEKIKTPKAIFNIGQIYRQEKKDIKKAIEIFESISNDIPEANMILARLYFKEYRRLWEDNSYDEAEIFKAKILEAYQRAVKMGYNQAHYELGEIYLEGKWFKRDINKAEKHFKKALEGDVLSENIKKVIKSNFVIINKKKKMTRKEYKQDYEYDLMSWMWMGASKCQELIGTDQKCIDTNLASLA